MLLSNSFNASQVSNSRIEREDGGETGDTPTAENGRKFYENAVINH